MITVSTDVIQQSVRGRNIIINPSNSLHKQHEQDEKEYDELSEYEECGTSLSTIDYRW